MSKNPTEQKIQCPRCGYDLRGVIGLWQESCPLIGKCSECGLDYEWSIVTQPEKYEPQWCVEFSPGWKSVLKSSFKTYCCSFVPWFFWSRVKMSYPIRWKRLAIYICLLLLPLLLSYVVTQSAVAVIVRYRMQQQVDSYNLGIPASIARMQTLLKNIPANYLDGIPEDQKDERKKQIIAILKQNIITLTQLQKTPVTINLPYLEAVLEAVFHPFAQTTSGTIGPGYYYGYPPPDQLYSEVFDKPSTAVGIALGTRNRSSGQWSSIRFVAMPVVISLSSGLVAYFLLPFALILLPASRRKAKVKWSHIIRVTVYGIYIPQILLLLSILLLIVALSISILEPIASNLLILVGGWGIWLGLIIWWSVAIKRYLKMPHGIVVSVLLCFLVSLLMAVIVVVSNEFL